MYTKWFVISWCTKSGSCKYFQCKQQCFDVFRENRLICVKCVSFIYMCWHSTPYGFFQSWAILSVILAHRDMDICLFTSLNVCEWDKHDCSTCNSFNMERQLAKTQHDFKWKLTKEFRAKFRFEHCIIYNGWIRLVNYSNGVRCAGQLGWIAVLHSSGIAWGEGGLFGSKVSRCPENCVFLFFSPSM